jgi:plasmid replication initiation protein
MEWKAIRRGWCFGEETFRHELLAQMGGQMGEHHYGMERWESAEDKAARIVQEELVKAGWTEQELAARPKGDPVKVITAARVRQETTMTLKWISQRLHMGAWTHVNKRLYEYRRENRRIVS